MANLKTSYMGIELKNPVIVGSNNLVTDPEDLVKIEKSGAAAIVNKSLFEEQIHLENLESFERLTPHLPWLPWHDFTNRLPGSGPARER